MYPTTHCPQFVTNVLQIPRNKYLESEPILFTPCLTFICPGKWPYCSSSWAPRWSNGKRSTYQCRRHKRHGSNSWVGKIPWRRKQQPSPVVLPGRSHRQRSLAGYSPWGRKRVRHDWAARKTTTQPVIQARVLDLILCINAFSSIFLSCVSPSSSCPCLVQLFGVSSMDYWQ